MVVFTHELITEITYGGDCFVLQPREQLGQKCSTMPSTEEKPCVFVKDNKVAKPIPKYKYIEERSSCIPAMHAQKLASQCQKKCGIFQSSKSSSTYDNVWEVPNTSYQTEEQSKEFEWSDKCKHEARYVGENDVNILQRAEMERSQKSYWLPTQTLKDKTNIEVINKTIAAIYYSNSVTQRVKELVKMEKRKFEVPKNELEQPTQNFQEFVGQFDPDNELKNGSQKANSTQVSLVLEENEKEPSSTDYNMKPNSSFKDKNSHEYFFEEQVEEEHNNNDFLTEYLEENNCKMPVMVEKHVDESPPSKQLNSKIKCGFLNNSELSGLNLDNVCLDKNYYKAVLEEQIDEEHNDKGFLTKHLEEKNSELPLTVEKHADVLPNKIKMLDVVKQLNPRMKSGFLNSLPEIVGIKSYYEGLEESLENQVKEAKNHVQLKMERRLKEDLSKCKSKALALEDIIDEKENLIKGLKQHIHDMQNEKDNILPWNINLLCKVEEVKNEAREHHSFVADYISINEKLLVMAQIKEEEVKFLAERLTSLQMVLYKTTEENNNLCRTLQALRKEMADLEEQNMILKLHYDLTKLKLWNAETELQKREESLLKISQQLTAVVENQDLLLTETEQLRSQLQNVKGKQVQIETDLIHSTDVINNLKEKIYHRDSEMCTLRAELKEIIQQNVLLKQTEAAKDKNLLSLESITTNLWHKIQALEKEVTEKEGQIAILKESFSEEFEH